MVVLVVTVNESPAHTKYFLDSSQAVCFQLQLGTRVCFYSARTVHGHSARARNVANTTENGP